jgi:hypothetical protein
MKSLPALRSAICLLFFAETTTYAWNGLTKNAHPVNPFRSRDASSGTEEPLAKESPERIIGPTAVPATRREILVTATTFSVAASVPFLTPQSSTAAAPLDAREAIRRGAANIPGYGSSDVFYPESFAGSWKVTRDVEFPSSVSNVNANANSPTPVLRLTYPVRFIQSIEDDVVVADRGYNQAELEAALARRGSPSSSSLVVLSYDWAANNPNVVNVAMADGTKKEIKVTKRATERTGDTVSSSEFQRITQEDTRQIGGPGGIPQISARRVVSKWKKIDDSTLEGIEIVYAVGGGGDPLSTSLTGQSNNNAAPTILSKSRLYLVR